MKNVPVIGVVERDDVSELPAVPEDVHVALAEIAGKAKEGLLAMSVAVGFAVMAEIMEADITAVVGAKGRHNPDRTASRHGSEAGSVVLGGRRVPVRRPRARTTAGEEVRLASYDTFASDDLLSELVMDRMLAGLATRRHRAANEPVGADVEAKAMATSKSAVSRRFVAGTEKALCELMSRDLSELHVAALMVDGVMLAGSCCTVALAICADGAKVPVGLWLGDTENKTVVTALLADIVQRGLDFTRGLLVVIDGAKALRAAVDKVFGSLALVQRCTLHKRRNVTDHLPKEQQTFVDRKLAKAFTNPDPAAGLRAATDLAKTLERQWPDAAGSLREGLEEMFTVRRLGLSDRLARTLASTNPIESMISVARTTTRNVKRWRDGTMVKRWMAAGLLNAERSFRKVKGVKDMPALVAALARHAETVTGRRYSEEVA